MGLDIRIPIGLLLGAIGMMLAAFGAVSNSAIYARSLGVNINLIWGLAMLAAGAAFLFFGAKKKLRSGSAA